MLKPKRIIHNRLATIVFWNDDTKTVVKCSENDEPDNYTAFCAAYCKKVFGNNSHLKRVIKDAENAKSEKPATVLDRFVKNRVMRSKESHEQEIFRARYLSIPSGSIDPMPGCTTCKHVNDCPSSCSHRAKMCCDYNHRLDYKY